MFFDCPRCGLELTSTDEKTRKCSLGHSYDRAKEGYFNLLLSSVGGTHGDNIEMVRARRDFLSFGYYEPMATRVAERVLSVHPTGGILLDMGLGEGYYTDLVEREIYSRDEDSCVLGFDISKDAVKLASRRNKRISLAVASSYSVPLGDGKVDTVLNLFSPMALTEVSRVLKPNGHFVFVYPGEDHLFGLKEAVYDTPYKNKPEPSEIEGFELVFSEEIRYTVTIDGRERVSALFMMTPYAYRTGKRERERALTLDSVTTELDFVINVYRKAD